MELFRSDLSAPTIASYTKDHRLSKETSTIITVPDGTQNGDLLILIFNIFSSKTPNRPAGWNILASVNNKENRLSSSTGNLLSKINRPISNFSVSHDYNNSSWILLRIPDGDTPIASSVATDQSWFPDPPALTHNFGKVQMFYGLQLRAGLFLSIILSANGLPVITTIISPK